MSNIHMYRISGIQEFTGTALALVEKHPFVFLFHYFSISCGTGQSISTRYNKKVLEHTELLCNSSGKYNLADNYLSDFFHLIHDYSIEFQCLRLDLWSLLIVFIIYSNLLGLYGSDLLLESYYNSHFIYVRHLVSWYSTSGSGGSSYDSWDIGLSESGGVGDVGF